MTPIRVLVIDDSVVARRAISIALEAETDMELVGFAPDGRSALARIAECLPDVVTLDVEMPEMDGLATLAAVRRQYPRLPIVMFSVLTARGAAATIDALLAGANDYAIKPSGGVGGVGGVGGAGAPPLERVRGELVPKIRALALAARLEPKTRGSLPVPPSVRGPTSATVGLVAIGASTGGPSALATLLGGLAATFPVPVVVVQHMPAVFTQRLADRLRSVTGLDVAEATDDEPLRSGRVLIAPGDQHLEVRATPEGLRTRVTQGPPENFCRPSVDVLFRSAAAALGPSLLGVILTGMGSDGLAGATALHQAGGTMLAQDEASSTVWSMPSAVVNAGLASGTYSLERLSSELTRRVAFGRRPPRLTSVKPIP